MRGYVESVGIMLGGLSLSSMAQGDRIIEEDLFRLIETEELHEGTDEMIRKLREIHHGTFIFKAPKSEEWSRVEIVFASETQKGIDDFKRPKKSLSDLLLFVGPFGLLSLGAMLALSPPFNYTLAAGCMLPAIVGVAKNWKSHVEYTRH